MKLPNSFIPKVKKKEIEEIIKKTLVEKVLAEDLGKQVKEYLENREISRKFMVLYDKLFDPAEQTDLEKIEKFNEEKTEKHIYVLRADLLRRETTQILNSILELEPSIKEEEVVHTVNHSFNITTNDFIYQLLLQEERFSGKERREDGKPGEPTIVYRIPLLSGHVKYLKFNKEHNEKVIQVLKERGYSVIIHFK